MHQPYPALGRLRVLDLTDRWGQLAGKLLAQIGADVVIGEAEGGHQLRGAWPLAVTKDGRPVSLYFWHFNIGKRSTHWDLTADEGRRRAAELLRAAQVVLVGQESYRELREHLPDALTDTHVVAMTPYGLENPDPDGNDDLHVAARSGMAGLSGYGSDDETYPIIPPVEQTVQSGGMYGAIAALLALRLGPDRPGELFDVSAQAAAFQGTEQLFACWVYRKEVLHRRGGGYATVVQLPRWQVTGTDGAYIYALGLLPRTQREWDDLRAWMRRHDAIEDLDDPEFDDVQDLRGRNPFDIKPAGDHAAATITRFLQSIDAEGAYRDGQAIKMGWAKIFQPQDTLGEEQFHGRRFFHRTAWPGRDESYLVPSFPTILSGPSVGAEPTGVMRPPAVGEHTAAVRAGWLRPAG